jgi:hypothetical protein
MSYSYAKSAWEVRWRDSNGRQRSRRFDDEAPAKAFDEAIHDQKVKERKRLDYGQGGGVYPYPTTDGTRWRCKVKRSDGSGRTSGASRVRRRPRTTADGRSRRWSGARSSTQRRPSESSGRAGLSGAGPTSRRARGRRTNAMVACGSCPCWSRSRLNACKSNTSTPARAAPHRGGSVLAGGNSLKHVQQQLRHADISTAERSYGHLERNVLAAGAKATEEAIARAPTKSTAAGGAAATRRASAALRPEQRLPGSWRSVTTAGGPAGAGFHDPVVDAWPATRDLQGIEPPFSYLQHKRSSRGVYRRNSNEWSLS